MKANKNEDLLTFEMLSESAKEKAKNDRVDILNQYKEEFCDRDILIMLEQDLFDKDGEFIKSI